MALRFEQRLNEKIMTESRYSEHHTKLPQEKAYHAVAGTKGRAGAVAGRTAYREEYERDRGPDRDEPLDGTESGQPF